IGKGATKSVKNGAVETVSICHQQHNGHDSPRNAKHRHRRAKSMIDERRCCLDENFLENHGYISKRNASTGSSSAARRAGYVAAITPMTINVRMEKAAARQVTIIPAKRAGRGSILTRPDITSATIRPIKPLDNVSARPSPKNCH